jgi:hypothetical protein
MARTPPSADPCDGAAANTTDSPELPTRPPLGRNRVLRVAPHLPTRVVHQMWPVRVVGRYEGQLESSLRTVLDPNIEAQTKSADRQRRYPGCDGIATRATQKPDTDGCHEPSATNPHHVVHGATLEPLCPCGQY